ncbi:MAG: FG-GAP-like repeat-containing protein [Saprospiraceae bacterium]|nr:FG-GAP-like repeat-containing protein [Saprospiraceae bacterium]MCF8252566.1 FG-GAP-like repeat-containing protein [Saprospiraceae bacterium]MCF8282607.1 FG-GAP-like repeat-containing protein [Bacteroidales bacterium]MCF8314146.1 FG-GAP-like repeat-containing protein [Saprospiraceae bacterium]MCF8442918.1 FG-GAP-like repeat-containing protein [Saprospiraceae bacterium]
MKNQLLLTFLLLFAFGKTQAQEAVVVVPTTNLLNSILGFSYNDCVVDMNNDQLDDVVRVTDNGMYIDYQQPDGSFTQSFFPITFVNKPSWSICAGDLDNNGYNDLLFGDGNAVSFVKANATGTGYAEYAKPEWIFSQRSTMSDIDNDGNLDAFVCHDVDQSHPYRNDGTGNMTLDQSLIVTADRPGNYAAIWTDYDNDGDSDLYITKCKGGSSPGDIDRTNLLYRNNGGGTYSEVGQQAGVDDNAQSWSTVFEDFDNDGDFDAFIVNHDFQNRFFLNNGDGTFTDIIASTGINPNDLGAWENASGDFNNDGYVDIFSQLQTRLYLNNGNLTFTGHSLPVSSGGIGDLNNDGFLDVVAGGTVYLNNGNSNNWLKINTIGISSNRNGIGARVELHGPFGTQIREIRSGQSFSPMSSLGAYFGIGQATQVDSVVVKWPSGLKTKLLNPAINMALNIAETGCLLPPSQLVVNGSTTICPNEVVELVAPDGFGYEWSNGATTQAITTSLPGGYSAVLTDSSGCVSLTNIVQVSLAQETIPVISADGETIFCEGGAVVLTAAGGENPVWSTGETGSSITVTNSGEYFVSTDAICSNDPLTSAVVELIELNADAPIVTGANIAPGDSVLLTATGENLQWYDAPTNGILLGLGNSLQTPILNQTTTYYVEAHHHYPGEVQTGGKPDNAGVGGLPTQGSYNLFNVWEPFKLVSVVVYVPNTATAGYRTIQLYDGNGVLLDENIFDLTEGTHELTLDFELPVGNDFSLRCLQNNLFRNTNASTQFPYNIGNMGEITGDALGNNYYYYFYDWTVQKKSYECVSERVPATVGVSPDSEVLKQEGTVLLSPNPTSGDVFVDITGKADSFRIVDATGRLVFQKPLFGNDAFELSLSGFASGIYHVQVQTEVGVRTLKLVIQ